MSDARREGFSSSYFFAAIIMTLMGGFFWAIRGAAGYGGETGGMLAGFGWALLWIAASRLLGDAESRPYASPWVFVAISFAIAFGGFTGYGVYTAWVRGEYFLDYPAGQRAIGAWTGYAMLFFCGIHWGGNAGCAMAWCAPKKPMTGRLWIARLGFGVAGALLAYALIKIFPQFFLPFYNEGIYSVPANKTCIRTLVSLPAVAIHIGLVFGFLAFELWRGDRRAAALISLMAIGFAIPFAVGAYWHTMRESSFHIDWWKNWEMSVGLGGGLTFGLAFWLFNRPEGVSRKPLGPRAIAFFRSGFPFWLPVATVIMGACDGVCDHYSKEHSIPVHLIIAIITAIPFIIRWRGLKPGAIEATELTSKQIIYCLLLIVISGFVVCLSFNLSAGNLFLNGAFVVYISVSLICALILARRSKSAA